MRTFSFHIHRKVTQNRLQNRLNSNNIAYFAKPNEKLKGKEGKGKGKA